MAYSDFFKLSNANPLLFQADEFFESICNALSKLSIYTIIA